MGAVATAPAAQAAPAAPMSAGGDVCRFVQTALANQGLTIGGTCPA
ncbi:hypothetical protein ACFYZH_23810 [Streptomyces abikoensis]